MGVTTLQFRPASGLNDLITVEVMCPGFSASTTSADDGSWKIMGVTTGTCTVNASAALYLSAELADVVVGSVDVTVPPNELLAGDLNLDGSVNIHDITAVVSNFSKSSSQPW